MALTVRQSNEDDSLDSNPEVIGSDVANDIVESVKAEDDTTKIKLNIPTIAVPASIADTDNENVKTAAKAALGALATDLSLPTPETEPAITPTPTADEQANNELPTEETTPTLPTPVNQDNEKIQQPTPTTKTPTQPTPKKTATTPEKPTTTPPTDKTTPAPNQPTAEQAASGQPETKQPITPESPVPAAAKEDATLPPPTDEQYKKNERPSIPKRTPADQSTLAEPTPPHSTTPPTIPKEELGKTGPHPTAAPSTLPPQAQNDTAAKLAQSKNWSDRMKDSVTSGAQGIAGAPKKALNNLQNAPRNIINNLKNNFESERNKTRQLRQERRQLETELSKLENKIDGINASRKMRIIRFWFPGIYASISGFGAGMANAKGQAKVTMLQSKLITAQTIKGLLKTAESISALVEANVKVLSWIVETIETVVLPILLILVYPILILIMWIFISFMGAIGAPITKSIKELGEQVNEIIKSLESVLEPENKKLKTRRNIQIINQMLASRNARNTLENPPPQTPANDEPNNQAANDNIESNQTQPTNSQQAA